MFLEIINRDIMSEDNFFEYEDFVEFIAEFIMVYEASRVNPQVYIQWYDKLTDYQKGFLLEVRDKQLEYTMRVAMIEEEAKKFEQSIIDEANKIIKEK
jgi:hypothetical protein